MLRSVQSCGDYEKMMQGAYENYLSIKFKDVKMQNVSNIILYEYVTEHPWNGVGCCISTKIIIIINSLGTEWERMATVL